jgi:hypothetical protein
MYTSINFINTKNIKTIAVNRTLKISLPFLSCNNMVFSLSYIDYTNDSNYYWIGKSENPNDTVCSVGNFTLMKNDNKFIGHLALENRSYELYDLTGGVQVLCETNFSSEAANKNCANNNVTAPSAASPLCAIPGNCTDNVAKILVLYTPAAAAKESDMNGKANLAINQLNQIWANSDINNKASLVSVQPLNFTETSDIKDDVDALAVDASANALRIQYQAEIVVLFTGEDYECCHGIAKGIEVNCNEAYAIVDVTNSTTSKYTFAHEVTHLYGGRHNDDNTNNAKGFLFKTGTGLFGLGGKYRSTLMNKHDQNGDIVTVRIEQVSNPLVNFLAVPTGDATHDNASKVSSFIYKISDFYQDPIPNAVFCNSSPVGSCNGNNPTMFNFNVIYCNSSVPGLTYTWYTSYGGFYWIQKATGVSANFLVGASDHIVKCEIRNWQGLIVENIKQYRNNPIAGQGFYCPSYSRMGNKSTENAVVEVEKHENSATIFPQPSNANFSIALFSNFSDVITINILDIQGKLVEQKSKLAIQAGASTIDVATNLMPGLYIVKIEGNSNIYTKKLVIN